MNCRLCGGPIPQAAKVWRSHASVTKFCSAGCRRKSQRVIADALEESRYAELRAAGATSAQAVYGRASVRRRNEMLEKLRGT